VASADVATTRSSRRERAGPSLWTVGREFWRYPSPRIIAVVLAVGLTGRIALAGWSTGDAVVLGVLAAYHPLNEWLLHNFLLHMRPVRVLGRTLDPLLARKHRAHHADPNDTPLVFIPTPAVWGALVLIAAGSLLLPTWELRVTTIVSMSAIGLVYEWTHHLVHTDYRPRTRWYRWIWRTHRLHHYKNENYWYAFTVPAIDVALRTWPQPSDVPTSPTVRDLLGTGEFDDTGEAA